MDELLSQLQAQGERLTQPRKKVLEVLRDSGSHMTVEDVRKRLHEGNNGLDAPTIYRVLQWLKQMGLVSQTDLGGEAIVYQFIIDHQHHHLVCLSCGSINDLADTTLSSLRRKLRDEYGFESRIDHLAIFGVCKQCQQKGIKAAGTHAGAPNGKHPRAHI